MKRLPDGRFSLVNLSIYTNPVIYLVEPDRIQREALTSLLLRTGFDAQGFADAEELLGKKGFPAPGACVVSELNLPGLNGLALLNQLRADDKSLPFIILTGDADINMAVSALHSKVSDYVVKPVVERDLVQRIKTVLRRSGQSLGMPGDSE